MPSLPFRQPNPWPAVLAGGGIAATLDIVYACIRNGMAGRDPSWVLQSVASGWFGSRAFEMGFVGSLVGLASHYAILFVAAAIYFAASTRLAVLRTRPAVCGAAFGVLVYLFMNFVVLPLSAFPFHPAPSWQRLLEGFFFHAVLVGMPIAFCLRHRAR
jgi:hypothetical protein